MIETLLIILVIIAAVMTFHIQKSFDERASRNFLRDERLRELANESKAIRTIELIGYKAYIKMATSIKEIRHKHKDQQNIVLTLTCGPDYGEGEKEIHKILPGNSLHLIPAAKNGSNVIDVYSNGYRIGRLALNEAETIMNLMKSSHLTGAYVAEQNCYGATESHDIKLVIYYEPSGKYLWKFPKKKFSELYRHYKIFETDNLCNKKLIGADFCQN